MQNNRNIPNARIWKWRILLAAMGCYLFYYCGRFNILICMKPICDEFGWDKTRMGLFVSIHIWTFAIGQLVNGNLADRWGRVLMLVGAVASCGANWAFSFSDQIGSGFAEFCGLADTAGMIFMTMGIFWSINAYFQCMGMPTAGRLISNWWPDEERGRAMGFFSASASLANVTVFVLASTAAHYWGWRAAFRYPVLLMAGVAVLFYLVTKDFPEQVGLKSPRCRHEEDAALGNAGAWERFLLAIRNRSFAAACLSMGMQYATRWGLITFLPMFFMEEYGWNIMAAGFFTSALPIGMAAGALSGGYLSDRFFGGKRATVITVSLIMTALCVFALPLVAGNAKAASADELSTSQHILIAAMLIVSGYSLHLCLGPYVALPTDLLGTHMAGTGIGVLNAFGYVGAALGLPIIGFLVGEFGYLVGFWTMGCCAIAGAVLIRCVRE